jgi:hypothetical protein
LTVNRAWIAGVVLLAAGSGLGFDRPFPLDCLPDRVLSWEAAEPESRFGAPFLPGIVLGPPGDSSALVGSVSVASLGFGGRVVLGFDGIAIEDRPGPDFVVFENAFFRGTVPGAPEDDYLIFAEPGIVEVSSDGEHWLAFPFDPTALADAAGGGGADDIDKVLYERLIGLAGITPTMTGNWTEPDDPKGFDATGVGGVSGAGGDAFDLATVGLAEARFVRITDADSAIGFEGSAEGFDLDAVVVLHGVPDQVGAPDSDGDRLSDTEELMIYLTNPADPDSDGDGADDGREIAGCRDPLSRSTSAMVHGEPRLWMLGGACAEARWTFTGSGHLYDLVRGDLRSLASGALSIDLGPLQCLEDDGTAPRFSCDPDSPLSREGFFYLVRPDGEPSYGRSSALLPREATGECP